MAAENLCALLTLRVPSQGWGHQVYVRSRLNRIKRSCSVTISSLQNVRCSVTSRNAFLVNWLSQNTIALMYALSRSC